MEYYRIWRIIVGYRWLVICLPIVAALCGAGLTFALPDQFESSALVLVRPIPSFKVSQSSANRNEVLDLPVNLSAPIDAPSKTYMEVIKSHAVAVSIVETLGLDRKKPWTPTGGYLDLWHEFKDWAGDTARSARNYLFYGRDIPTTPFERAVDDVEKKLVVSARKDTYVFDITYRAFDAVEAASVANMAAQIFLQQSSEAYRSESARARQFIESQLADSRQALEQARAATLAYKNSGATFDLKQEYNERLRSVSELQTTLVKAESKLAGMLRTEFKSGPAIAAQEAEIGNLRQQIAELQTRLRVYPEADAKLSSILLSERLAEESYEFFRKQYEEARIKESSNVAEIRIVSRAEPSVYPVRPVKYLYALVAFATAFVVAIGWALFAEALDPRVRTLDDLEGDPTVPVLGAIPVIDRT